jgi:nitroimidazol reductase NimA-like FMN-containing flavoprotein (pyridoxamine 5'-phosphate oxidase superfamily)
MTASDPIVELDGRFSSPGAVAVPWAEVVAVLDAADLFWLSTTRRDGRPHVTPLPAVWDAGALHFCTGPREQKARNLEHIPQCALTTGTNTQRSGLDVVVEGRAERITDPARLQRLAQLWNDRLGWDFDVVDGGFQERGAEDTYAAVDAGGHDLGHVFAVAPSKVLAFGKGEAFSQTRYLFRPAPPVAGPRR